MSDYVRREPASMRPGTSRLGHLVMELTERCDNDCVHCCVNRPLADDAARAREMTTVQIAGVLSEAAELGCLEVRFTGGEPLVRADFGEIYLQARRLGMRVSLFTNACCVTPSLAETLSRVPPQAPVEVSVYGMHRASYEAVTRSAGSFRRFRRGLDRLLSRGVPVVVKWVTLPANKDEIGEFEAWARGLPGATAAASQTVVLGLRSRRDDAGKGRVIASVRVSPEAAAAEFARDDGSYRREMAQFAGAYLGEKGDRLFTCGVGGRACIDAYGRAQHCSGLRAPECTVDLSSHSLEEALDQLAQLREVRAESTAFRHRCARCFLRGLCEQCPAKAWAEHGSVDVPVEYLCDIAHAQARHLGWLRDGEHAWEVADWERRLGES